VSLHVVAIGGARIYQMLSTVEMATGPGGPISPRELDGSVEMSPIICALPEWSEAPAGAHVKVGIPNPVPDVQVETHYQIPTRIQLPGIIAGPPGGSKAGKTEGRGVDAIDDGSSHRVIIQPFEPIERKPAAYSRVEPAYPHYALQTGLEGRLVVRILVDEEGRVEEAFVIVDSDLDVGFEEASVEAIRQWKFTPGIQNGNPVAVWMHIPVVFEVK